MKIKIVINGLAAELVNLVAKDLGRDLTHYLQSTILSTSNRQPISLKADKKRAELREKAWDAVEADPTFIDRQLTVEVEQ